MFLFYFYSVEIDKKSQTLTNLHNNLIGVFVLQFLATSVKNMLVMDLGLCTTFAGIIIPALTGHPNNHNMGETLSLTPDQASWLGN